MRTGSCTSWNAKSTKMTKYLAMRGAQNGGHCWKTGATMKWRHMTVYTSIVALGLWFWVAVASIAVRVF